MRDFDTICAIATPIGEGGIAIIRVSGENALEIVSKVFRAKSGTDIKEMKSYTMKYGHIYDGDDLIDEVIISYMKGPRSFTAEDVVEINCHGGVVSTNKVLESIIKAGARIAEPGEFTKRAFLNGRIDLSQAEAVMDLIRAKTDLSMKSALMQSSGYLSRHINKLREYMLNVMALVEFAVDFTEDDEEIEGLLILLNTVGGDVEAGLAIAEMIASLSIPTVSLVLGGGHSIGVPMAVSADYSFAVPSATMVIHPVRSNGMFIGVAQTYRNMEKIQDRITTFISEHSRASQKRLEELMLDTSQLVKDVGTMLEGKEAVKEGLIDEVGGIKEALAKLYEMIEKEC